MIDQQLHRSARAQAGFTLMELLVVLAILGLLAGLVGTTVLSQFGGAKTKTAGIQIGNFEQALEVYKLDVGRFPTTNQGLAALREKPSGVKGWNGPYLKEAIPQDPWGNDYIYKYPGTHSEFDISSLGQDAATGGEGEDRDVHNWE